MFLEALRRPFQEAPGRDSNQAPSQYKSEVLELDPACSVLFPCYDKVFIFFCITDCQCPEGVQSKCSAYVGKYYFLLFYAFIFYCN